MPSLGSSITIISKSKVIPNQKSTLMNIKLSVSDLPVLSRHDIQRGCLFTRPHPSLNALLPHFTQTLSRTLSDFLPLAGRLSTSDDGDVFLSCNDFGADFVFADAKPVHVSDVFAGIDDPDVVKEFISFDRAVSHEGHTRPILALQVTELIDGVFIVCSVNKAVTEDMLCSFIKSFAEMSRVKILRPLPEVLPPPPSPSPPPTQPSRLPTPPPSIPQTPSRLPPPSPSTPPTPIRIPPRQPGNLFLHVAPPHPMNLNNQVPEPHQMDTLSWTALGYCFTAGLTFNSVLAQVGNPNDVSFRVKLLSWLLLIALLLLLAANWIFARRRPRMAFVMDRAGTVIALISSVIAVTPIVSVYVSIGCAVVMIIVYALQYFL